MTKLKWLCLFLLVCSPAWAQNLVQNITVGASGVVNLQTKHNSFVYFNVTLTANATTAFIDGGAAGAKIDFNICQDATGGRTWVWPPNFQNTSTITISTTASACTTAAFITPDGLTWNNANIGGGGGGLPGYFNIKSFGAVGDAKSDGNVSVPSTGTALTDTTNNPWTSADAGKFIYCVFPGDGTTHVAVGTKISSVTDSGHIVINAPSGAGAATMPCVWYTQKDTASIRTTVTNATSAQISQLPGTANLHLGNQSTVYCPPGGYVVDGAFFIQHSATIQLGVNFEGDRSSCIIYQSPDVALDSFGFASIVDVFSTTDATFGGFTLSCIGANVATAGPLVRFDHVNRYRVHDILFDSCGTSGDASTGKLFLNAGGDFIVEQILDVTGSFGNAEPTIDATGIASSHFRRISTENPGSAPSIVFSGSGAHGSTGGFNLLESAILDEGSTPGCLTVSNTTVTIISLTCFAGATTGINVIGGARVNLVDVNSVPFGGSCGGGSRNALTVDATSTVSLENSTLQGCGTSPTLSSAISAATGATVINRGGNNLQICPGSPCPGVTVANQNSSTLGWSGGAQPISVVNPTPQTCNATSAPLLATAQNLCKITLTKNLQVLNISAQSGGNAPANSSCVTPPVITLSDGVLSATMTMTSGKTAWTSAIDASTNINGVFTSGNTLTVSIGANTCATAPQFVSVTFTLQSTMLDF